MAGILYREFTKETLEETKEKNIISKNLKNKKEKNKVQREKLNKIQNKTCR